MSVAPIRPASATPPGNSSESRGERPGEGLLELIAWCLLCAFVFSMPWEKGLMLPGIGSIARAVGVLAFAACAIALWRRGTLRAPNLALVLAAAFVGWSGLTWVWSLDRAATVARALTLVQLWALLWLLWEFGRSEARRRQLMAAYVGGALVGASIAFLRYGMHLQTYYRRYAATGFDPNDFGILLALSLPMALYLAFTGGRRMRWFWYAAGAVAIAAILLTASRTALLASFSAFGFSILTWRAASLPHRIANATLLGFLLLQLIQIAPAPSRSRLATIPDEVTSGSINSRKQIWKAGARVWLEYPLLGVGAGAYPEAVRPELGQPSVEGAQYVAHNTLLSVLVEGGVVGLALWGALMACLAVFIWAMPMPERALFAVLLGVWAIGISTLTWEHYKGTWLLFGLILAAWPHSWWKREGASR